MPSHAAKNILDRWIEQGQSSTGLIMEPHLARYKGKDGHTYEIEVAKEIDGGGLTGWTYRVVRFNKVPMGFWRILGSGKIHTRPINSEGILT